MRDEHITDMLPEYLDDLLDKDQKKKVDTHLKECESCKKDLNELRTLIAAFENEKQLVPPDSLRTGFNEMLEHEKRTNPKIIRLDSQKKPGKNTWAINVLKIAASIILLISSFMLGRYQQEQKSNEVIALLEDKSLRIKQTAMLSLMGNKSASKRIQGVNYIDEFSNPDETIVKALADRMLFDENTNVRLTAVEALEKFTASETVKNTFIKALKIEKDPGIQIAIIQTLVRIQEKKAIAPMQYLLEQEDTQPYVKEQLKSVLPSII